MIATLTGKIQERSQDSIIVNVGGVGFRVQVPTRIIPDLGALGSQVHLFTHLHVREDDLSLFGFLTEDELQLFEVLLTVSGIGPRVALGVLSAGSSETLRMAIAQGNVELLTSFRGIGKKTAQRLVLELKGKIDVAGLGEVSELSPVDEDVMNALINLGYSAAEAARAARAVPPDAADVETRLRFALQSLGSG